MAVRLENKKVQKQRNSRKARSGVSFKTLKKSSQIKLPACTCTQNKMTLQDGMPSSSYALTTVTNQSSG
jgi:hypothetical protein